ncbi:hypothetical protein B0H16DRAFT_1467985 [Mycena metata]|uniref:Uncharacterized protein n=1 Tax=Mycena metata TaxID=1033252 RepID=A0AAD7MWF7_9AGAR|nr:hypothetical protein B0H16DRAFT_1467985 [Mycena metata]
MDDNLGVGLGHDVHAEQKWWLNGYPFIQSKHKLIFVPQIKQLQGHVDISIRIRGSLAAGILYFTAARTERGAPYDIARFQVVSDDRDVVDIDQRRQYVMRINILMWTFPANQDNIDVSAIQILLFAEVILQSLILLGRGGFGSYDGESLLAATVGLRPFCITCSIES